MSTTIDNINISINNDNKTIYLPGNEKYDIKIYATDEGQMDYIITEFYSDNTEERRIVFYEIPLHEGKQMTQEIFDSAREQKTDEYVLKYVENGEAKEIHWNYVLDNDNSNIAIITTTETEGGYTSGSGSYLIGDYVTLLASNMEGYVFDGWFDSDIKVSENELYSFTAISDRTLEAKFIKDENKYSSFFKNGDASGYTIIDGYIVSGIDAGDMVEDLLNKLADGVKVYKGNALVTSGKLGTGMTIRHEEDNSEITVVIKGDLTGDGNADIADAKDFLESLVGNKNLEGAYEKAAEGFVEESAIKSLRKFLNFMTTQE